MEEREVTEYKEKSSNSNFDLLVKKDDELSKKFLVQKLEILYAAIPSSLLSNIANGAILLIVLWGTIPISNSIYWYTLLLFVTSARYLITKRFKSLEAPISNVSFWAWIYLLGAFSSGIIWGSAGILYFSAEFSFQLIFICFMLGGMCVGGLTILSSIKEIAYSYILATMLPITVQFFLAGETYYSMGLLCSLFILMCFITVNRNNRSITTVLNLQIKNSDLLEYYKVEKENAEKLNEKLKGEIDLRMLTESELSDLTTVAESTNKAKNDFLGKIHQTIGAPVNAILGAAKLLLDKDLEQAERETLNIIKQSAESLMATTNEILDFSKIKTQSLQIKESPTVIRELVHKAFRMTCNKATSKEISFIYKVDKVVPEQILADGTRVQQILSTLITEVFELAEQNSSVNILCERIIESSTDQILFRITCSEVSNPEDIRSNIFDSIYYENSETNFSLAISAALVKLMKGDIKYEISKKGGIIFSFWIPLVEIKEGNTTVEKSETKTIKKISENSLRVLVAEDNPVNQKLTKVMLESAGHSVHIAKNGLEAVSAYKSDSFDIILMDVQMPDMDGYTAVENIRRKESKEKEEDKLKIPIIALTAYTAGEDREKCFDSGMDDYISKPIKRDALIKLVEHYGLKKTK